MVAERRLRVAVAPLALSMRVSDRLKGFSAEKAAHRVRRGARKAAYESYDTVRQAFRLAYSRAVKRPSRRAIKALRSIFQ